MPSRLALAVVLASAAAHADPATVVVTPNAPVVIVQAPGSVPPGAEEEPPTPTPTPAPAPPAAPQNEAWSNVSHINGTPVPVGDRNRYLYKFKKTNIAVNPFGLLFGYYEGGAQFAISQNVALSISGSYYSLGNGGTSGYQVAASAPIYFRRTFSGPFLEPGVMLRSSREHVYYDAAACDTTTGCYGGPYEQPHDDWAGIEMLFGYQWTFDSGLDASLAFGVAKHLASNHTGSSDDADANGYFRVGYAF